MTCAPTPAISAAAEAPAMPPPTTITSAAFMTAPNWRSGVGAGTGPWMLVKHSDLRLIGHLREPRSCPGRSHAIGQKKDHNDICQAEADAGRPADHFCDGFQHEPDQEGRRAHEAAAGADTPREKQDQQHGNHVDNSHDAQGSGDLRIALTADR